MSGLADLGASKYISLTTYRRDGSPVATPVWVVGEGDCLRVITRADAGKAKRIRADGRVSVAACDMRGNVRGPSLAGAARLEDPAGTARTADLIRRRYGILGRFLMWRGRRSESVGITITPAAGP